MASLEPLTIEETLAFPGTSTPSTVKLDRVQRVWPLVFIALALVISLSDVGGSGPLWPDDSRYANAAAMIHDWIKSGQWLSPYAFAKENYAQYPGFSLPFHPPGYPGVMGAWFVVTGSSYESARLFVALCYGISACLIFVICRQVGASGLAAMLGALLFLSLPETARWARSTMSEIPSLTAFLCATYFFLRWALGGSFRWCLAAFAMAEFAFFCRVTTIGLMPGWAMFLLFRKDFRKLFSPGLIGLALVYLAINFTWVKIIGQFAQHEVLGPGENRVALFSADNLGFYLAALPEMVGGPTVAIACLGALVMAFERKLRPYALLWLGWFLGYYFFQISLTTNERRYFTFALPGIVGLAIVPILWMQVRPGVRWIAPVALCIAIATNGYAIAQLPRGVVGNEAIATRLAETNEPGNVLMACWVDQDLVFRYRCKDRFHERQMIRSDRALAIRVSPYAHVEPRPLATTEQDVLDVIKRGRIRYILTATSSSPGWEDRPQDMILADNTMRSMPEQFKLLDTFDLKITWGDSKRRSSVFLWQYLGELPAGPSELPVVIPTAGIEYQPSKTEPESK